MHIKTFALTLLAATGLALSGTAIAQSTNNADPQFDCARVRAKGGKCKFIPIEADQISGDKISPDQMDFVARPFAKMTSLLRIRADFRAEIVKSAEDL